MPKPWEPNLERFLDAEFTEELRKLDAMYKARTGGEIVCIILMRKGKKISTISGPAFADSVGPKIVEALLKGGLLHE